MKKIFILGASGSIGENALSVIESNKQNFELVGFSLNSNVEKANKIIKKINLFPLLDSETDIHSRNKAKESIDMKIFKIRFDE